MTVTLNVSPLADYLANQIMNKVDANIENYIDNDMEDLDWEEIVEQELQEDLPFPITDEMYDLTLEALLSTADLKLARKTIEIMIEEKRHDNKEWAKGAMYYNGMKESDFA